MKLSISLTLFIFVLCAFFEVPIFSQKIHYPSCIPDSTKFYFKHLTDESTINTDTFDKMNGLNNKQVQAWLNPFFHNSVVPSRSEIYIKMVSFQKKTQEYYSFIIATIFETPEQYLITVSLNGEYIDGLKISYEQNQTNSEELYDENSLSYINSFKNKYNFFFVSDTLILIQSPIPPKEYNPSNYAHLVFRMIETNYLIGHSGKIVLIHKN